MENEEGVSGDPSGPCAFMRDWTMALEMESEKTATFEAIDQQRGRAKPTS
jgi:hypothetical protein